MTEPETKLDLPERWGARSADLTAGEKKLILRVWEILGDEALCRTHWSQLNGSLQGWYEDLFKKGALPPEMPHGMSKLWQPTQSTPSGFLKELRTNGGPFHDTVIVKNDERHGKLSHRLQWYVVAKVLDRGEVLELLSGTSATNLNGLIKRMARQDTNEGDSLWGIVVDGQRTGQAKLWTGRTPTDVFETVQSGQLPNLLAIEEKL